MSHLLYRIGLAVGGAVLGAVVGVLGPFNYGYLLSQILGSNALGVGWVFCFFTVPVSTLLGGVLSFVAVRPADANWGDETRAFRAIDSLDASGGYRPRNDSTSRAPTRTSGMAIGSLICSISGLVILLFAGAIVDWLGPVGAGGRVATLLLAIPPVGQIHALVLGYAAKRAIRNSGGGLVGHRPATVGIVVGWVGLSPLLVSGGMLLVFAAIGTWLA